MAADNGEVEGDAVTIFSILFVDALLVAVIVNQAVVIREQRDLLDKFHTDYQARTRK